MPSRTRHAASVKYVSRSLGRLQDEWTEAKNRGRLERETASATVRTATWAIYRLRYLSDLHGRTIGVAEIAKTERSCVERVFEADQNCRGSARRHSRARRRGTRAAGRHLTRAVQLSRLEIALRPFFLAPTKTSSNDLRGRGARKRRPCGGRAPPPRAARRASSPQS